ncbi:ATP-binding protein [Alkaliphilus pronyensis]|uniref:ATP-binding protein n=1 Tax=Alkaliphilus pronyensis TaxID=1482732 RepID=A0A6I0EZ23_9FIRM|nr:ATP-binding protein [Alkaliphilus pronyensis]KAB3531630.1 ATP-binding protein [Alkaliphilus pronyensis]
MIKLFMGKKGSGKTKRLIDSANDSIKKVKGHVVYVDYDNSHMFQIDYRVRFISTKEYQITDEEGFYGFLCGIIASNYDIETVFIDSLYSITRKELKELEGFFSKLDSLEMKYNVSFILSVNCDKEEPPMFLSKYTSITLD